jgi:hypothetical protein
MANEGNPETAWFVVEPSGRLVTPPVVEKAAPAAVTFTSRAGRDPS